MGNMTALGVGIARRRTLLLTAAAIVVLALGGGSAAAALDSGPREDFSLPVEPALAGSQAEIVLGGIVAWLTDFVRDAPGAPRMVVSAPVRAVPSGAIVTVTFPGLELAWDDGTRLRAGDVAIPITPRQGGQYDFTVALPARLEFGDTAGVTTSVLTIAAATVSGSWGEAKSVLRNFDAALRDIEVVSADAATGDPAVLSIATFEARHTLDGDAAGTWRGAFETELSGIRARGDLAKNEDVSIDHAELAVRYAGFTAADWYTLSGAPGLLGADRPAAPGDAKVRTGSAQGTAEFDLSGMEFTDGASASAAVREAGLRLDVGRGPQDLWDVSADLSLSDLSTSGFQGGNDVTVGEVGIESRARDYPLARWRELADRFGLDATGDFATRSEQQRRELADALRGVRWGTSAAQFSVARLAVGPAAAPRFRLDEGSFRVTFDGRGGEFDVAVRDLDKFETYVAAAERGGAGWVQGTLNAACVGALREAGEAAPPDADNAGLVYGYHISLTADGGAIVNGAPIEDLVERCTTPMGVAGRDWETERGAAFEALDAGRAAGAEAGAEAGFKAALAIAERSGPTDSKVMESLSDLGIFYSERGRNGEALPLLERAAGLRERAVGPDHPDLAFSLFWLGRTYAALGRFGEAEARLRGALAIGEKALGPDSLDVAWDLDALAVLYRDQARYDEAEVAFERVMAIAEAKLTETDDDLARFLEDYAALKRATGRAAEAAEMETHAAAIRAR